MNFPQILQTRANKVSALRRVIVFYTLDSLQLEIIHEIHSVCMQFYGFSNRFQFKKKKTLK